MVSIGIVGGTGYTGVELLRILLRHASADVRIITSRSESGTRVVDYFPSLRGKTDLVFTDQAIKQLSQCDVVFFLHLMVWQWSKQDHSLRLEPRLLTLRRISE